MINVHSGNYELEIEYFIINGEPTVRVSQKFLAMAVNSGRRTFYYFKPNRNRRTTKYLSKYIVDFINGKKPKHHCD